MNYEYQLHLIMFANPVALLSPEGTPPGMGKMCDTVSEAWKTSPNICTFVVKLYGIFCLIFWRSGMFQCSWVYVLNVIHRALSLHVYSIYKYRLSF